MVAASLQIWLQDWFGLPLLRFRFSRGLQRGIVHNISMLFGFRLKFGIRFNVGRFEWNFEIKAMKISSLFMGQELYTSFFWYLQALLLILRGLYHFPSFHPRFLLTFHTSKAHENMSRIQRPKFRVWKYPWGLEKRRLWEICGCETEDFGSSPSRMTWQAAQGWDPHRKKYSFATSQGSILGFFLSRGCFFLSLCLGDPYPNYNFCK